MDAAARDEERSPEVHATGANGPTYIRRPLGEARADVTHAERSLPTDGLTSAERIGLLGIDWDWADIDLEVIGGSDGSSSTPRSLARFRANLPVIIWDAARLEGNNFTLPEVRTLLDGVTVEGKRVEDQDQILALNDAYKELDRLVSTGEFELSKNLSDRLHGLVARFEAIEAGGFRGEGSVHGGGSVRLSSGGVIEGRDHGEGGALLVEAFNDLLDYESGLDDPRQKALVYAAAATRHQFYFDGNKRTAKLMASGVLMSAGFDAISVPYTRLYEQNVALDRMFDANDATSYMRLLAECAR